MTPTLAGKPRPFGRGLGLTIVTLGIYALYWHYKAIKEIYDQERKPGEYPIMLYILYYIPLVNLVASILYMSRVLDFLNAAREARKLEPTFGIGGFLAWYILGSFIIVGPFVAYWKLQTAINGYWDAESKTRSVPPSPVATLAAKPAKP